MGWISFFSCCQVLPAVVVDDFKRVVLKSKMKLSFLKVVGVGLLVLHGTRAAPSDGESPKKPAARPNGAPRPPPGDRVPAPVDAPDPPPAEAPTLPSAPTGVDTVARMPLQLSGVERPPSRNIGSRLSRDRLPWADPLRTSDPDEQFAFQYWVDEFLENYANNLGTDGVNVLMRMFQFGLTNKRWNEAVDMLAEKTAKRQVPAMEREVEENVENYKRSFDGLFRGRSVLAETDTDSIWADIEAKIRARGNSTIESRVEDFLSDARAAGDAVREAARRGHRRCRERKWRRRRSLEMAGGSTETEPDAGRATGVVDGGDEEMKDVETGDGEPPRKRPRPVTRPSEQPAESAGDTSDEEEEDSWSEGEDNEGDGED